MKNESISKLLKISIIAGILIMAFSAAYYFVIFLPNETRQETQRKQQVESQDFLFSMKQKCQEAGRKLYEEDVKEMGRNNLFVPEYIYNQKLNTCLYAGGYVQEDSLQKWIKDVYSNKEIFNFISAKGKSFENTRFCDTCISNEEFERQKQELFSQ